MEQINNAVLIQGATLSDIEAMIKRAVDARISAFYQSLQERRSVLVRRKEAASVLGVSLPTLDAYGKAGIVHPRHVGGRVFYSEEELLSLRSRKASSTVRP